MLDVLVDVLLGLVVLLISAFCTVSFKNSVPRLSRTWIVFISVAAVLVLLLLLVVVAVELLMVLFGVADVLSRHVVVVFLGALLPSREYVAVCPGVATSIMVLY